MIYGFPSEHSGIYRVKCVQSGGTTVRGYAFTENEELDLLDKNTDTSIRAYDFDTADRMCTRPGCPFTADIAAGRFVVVETARPDASAWARDLKPELWGT